jgi:hypothetical protein
MVRDKTVSTLESARARRPCYVIRDICAVLVSALVAGCTIAKPPEQSSAEESLNRYADSLVANVRDLEKDLKQQGEQLVKLHRPLALCTKRNALKLAHTSSETADVAARAAVGLCGKEELAYRSAVGKWRALETSNDVKSHMDSTHDKLVEMAVTIIVRERQHQVTPSPQAVPPRETSNAI